MHHCSISSMELAQEQRHRMQQSNALLLALRPIQCSASFTWHGVSYINWQTKAKHWKLMHYYIQASVFYSLNGLIWILLKCRHLLNFIFQGRVFFVCLLACVWFWLLVFFLIFRRRSFRLITSFNYDSTILIYCHQNTDIVMLYQLVHSFYTSEIFLRSWSEEEEYAGIVHVIPFVCV